MGEDLFEYTAAGSLPHNPRFEPLAARMRPQNLEEMAGQSRLLGPGSALRRWLEADRLPSLIFWGPPGCGKTTLAQLIAHRTQARFETLSAVLSGVKDIREAVERAKKYGSRKTILFVDEIHRFNKGQQDALLPHVENGTLILIGATTENPSFELNRALLSRTRVLRLEPLQAEDIEKVLNRALVDSRGLAGQLHLTERALKQLAFTSEGDARRGLTALEALAEAAPARGLGTAENPVDLEEAQELLSGNLNRQPIPYDKAGEEHYNVISAFIKSMRASDADAAVYYLARMIQGGEDPLFIARRIVVFASEDVGNADPRALTIAIAAMQAVELIGLPEARINLSQAVIYMAKTKKSRASYNAIGAALHEVDETGALPVPQHLRNFPSEKTNPTSNLPAGLKRSQFLEGI